MLFGFASHIGSVFDGFAAMHHFSTGPAAKLTGIYMTNKRNKTRHVIRNIQGFKGDPFLLPLHEKTREKCHDVKFMLLAVCMIKMRKAAADTICNAKLNKVF